MSNDKRPASDNPVPRIADASGGDRGEGSVRKLLLSEDRFEVVIGPRRAQKLSFTIYNREPATALKCRISSDSPWLRIEGEGAREITEPNLVSMIADPSLLRGPAPSTKNVSKYAVGRVLVDSAEGAQTVVVRLRLLRRFIPDAVGLGVICGLIPWLGELVGIALVFILVAATLRPPPTALSERDEAMRSHYFNLSMAVSVTLTALLRRSVWFAAGIPWGM